MVSARAGINVNWKIRIFHNDIEYTNNLENSYGVSLYIFAAQSVNWSYPSIIVIQISTKNNKLITKAIQKKFFKHLISIFCLLCLFLTNHYILDAGSSHSSVILIGSIKPKVDPCPISEDTKTFPP